MLNKTIKAFADYDHFDVNMKKFGIKYDWKKDEE